jgi:hemerythrin-like metal-binding protein
MRFFVWKPEFALGLPEIDAEHQRFSEIMNDLYAAIVQGDPEAEACSALSRLIDYATSHFGHEEEALSAVGYPHLLVQRKQHECFSPRSWSSLPRAASPLAARFIFMKDWLLEHVLGTDREYANWLATEGHRHLASFPTHALKRA